MPGERGRSDRPDLRGRARRHDRANARRRLLRADHRDVADALRHPLRRRAIENRVRVVRERQHRDPPLARQHRASGCLPSESPAAPQHGAAYVQRAARRYRAVIDWSADVAAAPHFACRTAINGHWLPGIQRLTAALAQVFGARCGGVAVREHEQCGLSALSCVQTGFRERGCVSSTSMGWRPCRIAVVICGASSARRRPQRRRSPPQRGSMHEPRVWTSPSQAAIARSQDAAV